MGETEKGIPNVYEELSKPFLSSAIEWKPQVVSKDGKRALAAAYVDMREYEDRLDKVAPGWTSSVQFLLTNSKVAAVVSLTVNGVTRVNVGEANIEDDNAFTTAFAQAFKRACSDFGLGRYLYRLPQVWCDYDPNKRQIVTNPELPDWAIPEEEKASRAKFSQNGGDNNAKVQKGDDLLAKALAYVIPDGLPFAGKTLGDAWKDDEIGKDVVKFLAGIQTNPKGETFSPKNTEEKRLQSAAKYIVKHSK